MGARRKGRQAALQILYQLDVGGSGPDGADEALARFFELYGEHDGGPEDEARAFAETLVRGCASELQAIDAKIREVSRHWRLERMARVDRNVMRLAVYELMALTDVPRRVTLNEAVELAKRFGDENSAAFVNGVLDRIASELGKD